MNQFDLFFELSHQGRYAILQSLAQHGTQKHVDFEKNQNLPGPEVSRHLKRLQNLNLITKTSNGGYILTSFGKMVCSLVPFFENGVKFSEFINSHEFKYIPVDLLLHIGNLNNIELRTSTMENISLWNELITNASKFVFCITDQIMTSLVPIIQNKLISNKQFEVKAIIDSNLLKSIDSTATKNINQRELAKNLDLYNNIRIKNHQDLALICTDKGALIFLRSKNAIDYNQGVFSTSEMFITAGKKIFSMLWERSKIIKHSDLESD